MGDKEKRQNSKLYRMANPYDKTRYQNSWTKEAVMVLEDSLKIKQKNEPSENTVIRQDIFRIITNMLSQGKGKIEILTCLHNKYPNSSLAKFFEGYIDDQIRKFDKTNKTRNVTIGER